MKEQVVVKHKLVFHPQIYAGGTLNRRISNKE
jgi:hypothetical protein